MGIWQSDQNAKVELECQALKLGTSCGDVVAAFNTEEDGHRYRH